MTSVEGTLPGLVTTVLLFLAVLAVRRFLPVHHRHRARVSALLLVLSVLLRPAVLAAAYFAASRAAVALEFGSELFFSLGLSVLLDLLAFDLVLERINIHVLGIVRDVLLATVFLVISLVLLGRHGVDILPLVTTSAVLTAVVGLALQSTIANLFAGLSMQLDRSFAIGDWIQVGARVGRISQIKWRSTSILTQDNDLLVVPNGQLTTNEVLNLSGPTRPHRAHLRIGFHYRHAPNEVKLAILEAVQAAPGVLAAPPPSCAPCDFADSGVTYRVSYWIEDMDRDLEIDGEVRTRIWYAAKRARLEIPYPTRTVLTAPAPGAEASDLPELEKRIELIARIDAFRPLDAADRRLLADRMCEQHFAEGEPIIRQGEPGDSLFLVKRGHVAVLFEQGGVSRPVATLGQGDFFGEMSLFTGEPRSATCAAQSDVFVYVIDHASFGLLLESKPALVDEISSILGRRSTALRAKESERSEGDGAGAEGEERRLMARIRAFFNLRS